MKKLSSLLVILLFTVTASLARDPRKASGRGSAVASETLTAKQKVSGARGALATRFLRTSSARLSEAIGGLVSEGDSYCFL